MKLKKTLGVVLVTLLSMLPIVGYAAEKVNLSDYETLGLKETLESEKMKEEFKKYSESDDQINIYMFRGQGCGYCKAFLTFLNGITDEYGKYFKLVSFETWYNNSNSELLKTISNFVENPAQGVPYIIIGEHVFPGYASDYDESIKSAILELYNSNQRYDVFEAYNNSLNSSGVSDSAVTTIVIWDLVFTTIATVVIILVIKKTINNKNKNLVTEDTIKTQTTDAFAKKKPVKKSGK